MVSLGVQDLLVGSELLLQVLDAGWVWWLLLVFLVPAVRIAWGFLSWRMNIYVITNRRVVESTGCSANAWPTRRSRSVDRGLLLQQGQKRWTRYALR